MAGAQRDAGGGSGGPARYAALRDCRAARGVRHAATRSGRAAVRRTAVRRGRVLGLRCVLASGQPRLRGPGRRRHRHRPGPASLGPPRPRIARRRPSGRAGQGARVVGLCTGSFALAAAGILDGLTATTHWMYADELASRYPQVRVDRDVLYAGNAQVMTSAGTASGLDLCIELLRRDHGAAVANDVARRMVIAPHREGGQAQFVRAKPPSTTDRSLGPVLMWGLEHLDE